MDVIYESSNGRQFSLNSGIAKLKSANFHKYSFGYEGYDQRIGTKIREITKDPQEYEMVVWISGSRESRISYNDSLHDCIDVDLLSASASASSAKLGRLIWGDWYTYGLIMSSETYPKDDDPSVTIISLTFLSVEAMWIKEKTIQLLPWVEIDDNAGLDFPFNFPFDFSYKIGNSTNVNNDHHIPCDAKICIYGPCENPRVMINDYPYQVFATLETGEYMIIDTKQHLIEKYSQKGTVTNLFNSRQTDTSIFKQVPSGELSIARNANFGVYIILLQERSEPKWS